MTKLPIKESDIQASVMELLQRSGYMCWRNSVGAVPYQNKYGKQWVRYGQPGQSDIFGVSPHGTFVALEIKTPAKRSTATAAQLDFIARVKAQGGIAAVVTSSSEVATLLKIPGLF